MSPALICTLYPLGVRFELLRPRSKPVGAPGVLLRSHHSVSDLYPLLSALYPLGVRSELLRARSQPVGAPVFLLSSHKRCVPALYPLCIRSECARSALITFESVLLSLRARSELLGVRS